MLAYPAPLKGESLARRIAQPHLPGEQTEIIIRTSYDKNRQPVEAAYDRAAEEISGHLSEGRDVAMLCLGDPFLYGSFQYLFVRLDHHLPVVVVPGISAPAAGTAAAHIALTAGGDCLAVVPATLDEDVIATRLAGFDAAVIVQGRAAFRQAAWASQTSRHGGKGLLRGACLHGGGAHPSPRRSGPRLRLLFLHDSPAQPGSTSP